MKDTKKNTGENNTGYWNSGYRNSGDRNSGDGNSGYGNSGDRNSGDGNSGYRNSGDRNSGDGNSGYGNSGYGNSGDRNSGIFNTDEPKIRAFNKECDLTYTEFRDKFGYQDIDFPLNVWKYKEDMTDEEKKSINGWEEMGGYLKTLSYKEAWAEGWKTATQEQKDWYKSLPNFDAKIFEEITGIRIDEPQIGKKVKIRLSNDQIVEGEIIE
jgi:hypothetical protein